MIGLPTARSPPGWVHVSNRGPNHPQPLPYRSPRTIAAGMLILSRIAIRSKGSTRAGLLVAIFLLFFFLQEIGHFLSRLSFVF